MPAKSPLSTHHYPLLFLLILSIFFLSLRINASLRFPFPPINQLIFDISKEFSGLTSVERPLASEGGFRDFSGLLLGMRRLTADIAWISVLQYYGSHETEDEGGKHPHVFGAGKYFALKKMVLRVTRLDPSFVYAYLYGAGAMGWNLDRPEEAMEILQEGIRYNPTYWKFRLYVGALVYKKKGEFDNMIGLLEDAVRYPDCPTMIKSILGTLYEERGKYPQALKLWIDIFESSEKDMTYKQKAERHIDLLRKKLGL